MAEKNVLITGSNKGIGFEMGRQLARLGHQVILTARDPGKGRSALEKLKGENLSVKFIPLDISNSRSIGEAVGMIKAEGIKLDVLINNAAILLKEDRSLLQNESSVTGITLQTNAVSQLEVIRAFLPLMLKGGRIINVSSEGGSMTGPVGGWSPAYCISKSLLNAMTRHLAYELVSQDITVCAMCPGWVKTDMGGKSAPLSVKEGADTGIWLATAEDIPTGKFFSNRKVIPW
jgi:NAD(P)-dependent dehydrogenase (short-subunit alcohol dehydrogenase family)